MLKMFFNKSLQYFGATFDTNNGQIMISSEGRVWFNNDTDILEGTPVFVSKTKEGKNVFSPVQGFLIDDACPDCYSTQYKLCPSCGGTLRVDCPDCYNGKVKCDCDAGEREVPCRKCSETGTYRFQCPSCKGAGKRWLECTKCTNGKWTDGRTCPKCDGLGKFEVTCNKCQGRGEIELTCDKCRGSGKRTLTCNKCEGTGSVSCRSCRGSGEIRCSGCSGQRVVECGCDSSREITIVAR